MFRGNYEISAQDLRESSSSRLVELGKSGETIDGRKYRYAEAGGSTLAPGKMNEQSAIVANHANMVTAAAAAGTYKVTVTLGNTAATANQYAGGYLNVNDVTGEGIAYLVKGHPAASGLATLEVTLAEPIIVALDSTSNTTLMKNLYAANIIVPSAATVGGVPTGVANVSITNAYFGWLQTSGPCSLLCANTVFTLGEEVSQGVSLVAGSGSLKVATNPTYGHAMQLGVDTEYQMVNLTLN